MIPLKEAPLLHVAGTSRRISGLTTSAARGNCTWGQAGHLGCADLPLPQALGVLVIILGFVGGGLWALIPAILRAKGWLNEVISTLLLNYIAALFVSYFVFGPWRDAASANFPQTPQFVDAMRLPMFGATHSPWPGAGTGGVALIYLVLRYSVWGYDMRPRR